MASLAALAGNRQYWPSFGGQSWLGTIVVTRLEQRNMGQGRSEKPDHCWLLVAVGVWDVKVNFYVAFQFGSTQSSIGITKTGSLSGGYGAVLFTFPSTVALWGPWGHPLLPLLWSHSGVSCTRSLLTPALVLLGRIIISVSQSCCLLWASINTRCL